jgi:hypothetical protein
MPHVPRLALQDGGRRPQLGCQAIGVLEQLRGGADRSERVPELVGECGEELVLLPIGLAQQTLVALAPCDVARDLRCADDLPFLNGMDAPTSLTASDVPKWERIASTETERERPP